MTTAGKAAMATRRPRRDNPKHVARVAPASNGPFAIGREARLHAISTDARE
jgi:hypothetical protein